MGTLCVFVHRRRGILLTDVRPQVGKLRTPLGRTTLTSTLQPRNTVALLFAVLTFGVTLDMLRRRMVTGKTPDGLESTRAARAR
jgi:hypothetical protein